MNTGVGGYPQLVIPNRVVLASVVVGRDIGPTGSIKLLTIPQTFRVLRLTLYARGDAAAAFVAGSLQFNGDTGANYNVQSASFAGGTANAARSTAQTSGSFCNITASTAPANIFSSATLDIANYSSTIGYKSWISIGFSNPSTSAAPQADYDAGYWASTAPITSITILAGSGNFAAGSTLTLDGIS